jgi:Fe-S cluster assembly protein SufD
VLSETMSTFQQEAMKLAAKQQAPEWLSALRDRGSDVWTQSKWPSRKTELWKYTSLLPLQKHDKLAWGQADAAWRQQVELMDLEATRLVLVNGVPDLQASDPLPPQLSWFSTAGDELRDSMNRYLGKILDTERHLFAALSNAWVNEGVVMHLKKGERLEKPLYLVHVSTTEGEQSTVASPRLLLVLEEGAEAEVIEHYVSGSDEQNGFVNAITEIDVGANAELHHCRVNLEQEQLIHIGGVHVRLHRDARLYGFTLAEGSKLKRIDYQINHCEPGAHAGLNGIYLAQHRQLIDYHTNMEHAAPHCTSDEVFRGIIGDHAHAVFNGRIHIHPDAQKTLAELSNRNLLTSNTAEIDTKPELEIYADDVRCAHGATVSQLDPTALYYLQSRGVPADQARVMLSFGFVNELLGDIRQPVVREFLERHLTRLLYAEGSLVLGADGRHE